MPSTFISRTSQQSYAPSAGGMLPKVISETGACQASYHLLRCVALYPVVRLGIELMIGILSKSHWHIVPNENSKHYGRFTQDELESMRLSLQRNIDRHRDIVLNNTVRNLIIYGWQSFERIIEWNSDEDRYDIAELKPLLQDFTYILTDRAGNFAGIRNIPPTDGKMTDIPKSEVLLFNVDVIGQNWYGTPLLLSAVEPYMQLREVNQYNNGYMDRLAHVLAVVQYPPEKEHLEDGTIVDNYELACEIADGLSENSVVVLPRRARKDANTIDATMLPLDDWAVTPLNLTIPAAGDSFRERIQHLEGLLINALGLPTRVVLDGQFGSYSNGQTFRETSYDILQARMNGIVSVLNEQFIDPLLELNWDAAGLFHILPSPLSDDSQQNLFRLYGNIKDNPAVDMTSVHEQLGIPDTETSDKYTEVDSQDPQALNPDVIWVRTKDLASKLGMSNTSIVSRIKRFIGSTTITDINNMPYKATDNQYKVPLHMVETIFGVPIHYEKGE